MRKVYDFSTFNYLYEAESTTAGSSTSTESSKLYDKTLGLIITTALNSYSSELTFPEKLYDQNIDADIASVKAVGAEEKPKALVAIMDKVKAASEDNTLEGAKEAVDAWVAAGTKATEALAKMVDQYKDKPEELKHINDFINARLDAYLKGIQDSSKANTLKGALSTKNESGSYYGSDYIFEGILEGKKGMIGDISKQITLVNAKLASLLLTPGMEADVKRLQTEVTKISADMGALLGKKNSEISKDEIKKAAARLAEIPTEADKAAETMLKQDTTNKEAAAILVQALGLVDEAKDKEVVYLGKKEEALKKEKDSSVIKYEESKAGEANGKVAEFQKLVMDKFKDVKSISGLSQFKNMGTSGKFGPSTAEMVKILKSGYGLPDSDSPDITGTLFAELKKDEEIKESRILSFEGFYGINEAFDVKAATQTASKSSSGSSGGGKKKGKGKSHKIAYKKLRLLYKKGDEGSPVVAINRIVGQTSDEKNYTEDTMERVKDFQKLNGLYKDGVAGEDTLTALFNTRGAYKAEPKPKLNDEKAPRGPWAYQMIAKILGETYELPDPKKNNVSSDIGDIFKAIVKATNGPGTDEQALVKAIKRIKTVDDIKVLNSMFDQAARNKANNELRIAGVLAVISAVFPVTIPFTGLAALGTFIGSYLSGWDYYSLAAVINGELGASDTAEVEQIKEHLEKVGAKVSYSENGGRFVDDTFTIVV